MLHPNDPSIGQYKGWTEATLFEHVEDQSGLPGQTFKRENNISLPSGWPGPGMLHHVSQPTWRIQFIYSEALGLALDNQKNKMADCN